MKIVDSCECMYLVGARVSFEALKKNCLQNYMHAKKEEEEEEVELVVGGRIEDFSSRCQVELVFALVT